MEDADEDVKWASGDEGRRWCRWAVNRNTWSLQQNEYLTLLHPSSPGRKNSCADENASEWRLSCCAVHKGKANCVEKVRTIIRTFFRVNVLKWLLASFCVPKPLVLLSNAELNDSLVCPAVEPTKTYCDSSRKRPVAPVPSHT